MNALAVELLGVAKEYLGPAAPAFLSRELTALGVNANTVEGKHILPLAERARLSAGRVMDGRRAGEFAQALAAHGGRNGTPKVGGDHRLASDAAAKLFAGGRLRQAEQAYRELVAKHADVDAYAGLARTLVSLEDADGALVILREGAAAFARKNDRISAIAVLGVAVEIAPADLNAHRRLAAALANQGDLINACAEYGRFVDVALAQRDTRRAWLELAYGRETLGDLAQLLAIADRVAAAQGGAMPTPPPLPRVAAPPSATAPAPVPAPTFATRQRPTMIGEAEVAARVAAPPTLHAPQRPTIIGAAEVRAKMAPIAPSPVTVQPQTRPAASSAVVMRDARTFTHAERSDVATAADLLARAGLNGKPNMEAAAPARPARPPVDLEAELARLSPRGNPADDAVVITQRATMLIAARDQRATEAALDAARKLLALHKLSAASDILLDYIAAGYRDREAQRLLIEVNCEIGSREVAREKCALLGAVYRLDGQGAVAEDVERLARIL
ncbi:MAG: hypothetical protein E6I28_07395 [Chloroflexi bacterium]|nr:MAG: hypothetical protein E6I28_07395 [Chloroflexota bacterium]